MRPLDAIMLSPNLLQPNDIGDGYMRQDMLEELCWEFFGDMRTRGRVHGLVDEKRNSRLRLRVPNECVSKEATC